MNVHITEIECVYEWPTLSVYDSEGSMKQNVPSDLVVVVMGLESDWADASTLHPVLCVIEWKESSGDKIIEHLFLASDGY